MNAVFLCTNAFFVNYLKSFCIVLLHNCRGGFIHYESLVNETRNVDVIMFVFGISTTSRWTQNYIKYTSKLWIYLTFLMSQFVMPFLYIILIFLLKLVNNAWWVLEIVCFFYCREKFYFWNFLRNKNGGSTISYCLFF